jgi:hypothetical protein
MIKWRARLSARLTIAALSLFVASAQQKIGIKGGQEYASIKLGPDVWHIEDTVNDTYRDSMYLVEGNDRAALIDT